MNAQELVSAVLLKVKEHVEPGVTTFALDAIAEVELKKLGGFSYNKNYHPKWARFPYPAVTCISVNNEMAHGIPSQRVLKNGDLVHIDLGVIDNDGNCGDAAFSIAVGDISKEDEMLLHYAKKCLYNGIKILKNGATIDDVAREVSRTAGERKFVVNHQLCGHGIGKHMHEKPDIYYAPNHYHNDPENFDRYQKFLDFEFKTGMVICMEPVISTLDKWGVVDPKTGWTYYNRYGKKSAMFEEMVKITDDGYEILTTHLQSEHEFYLHRKRR